MVLHNDIVRLVHGQVFFKKQQFWGFFNSMHRNQVNKKQEISKWPTSSVKTHGRFFSPQIFNKYSPNTKYSGFAIWHQNVMYWYILALSISIWRDRINVVGAQKNVLRVWKRRLMTAGALLLAYLACCIHLAWMFTMYWLNPKIKSDIMRH